MLLHKLKEHTAQQLYWLLHAMKYMSIWVYEYIFITIETPFQKTFEFYYSACLFIVLFINLYIYKLCIFDHIHFPKAKVAGKSLFNAKMHILKVNM